MGAVLATDVGRKDGGPDITVERGQRAVFCGLTSIVWLHRKNPRCVFSGGRLTYLRTLNPIGCGRDDFFRTTVCNRCTR